MRPTYQEPRSQVAKAICSLRSDGRFLLTGTPIENSLSDLRSLFHFLTPGYLSKVPEGLKPDERKWFEHRHLSQAAPYILRRGKALVAPELPEVIEQVVYCEMGQAQRGLYNAVHQQTERDLLDLAGGGAQQGRMRMAVFAQILKLRQICAEPRLVDDKLKLEDSAKLEVFLEVLDDAITGGHRILVFFSLSRCCRRSERHWMYGLFHIAILMDKLETAWLKLIVSSKMPLYQFFSFLLKPAAQA